MVANTWQVDAHLNDDQHFKLDNPAPTAGKTGPINHNGPPMTPTLPTFAQSLAFVGFVGASFVVLRYALSYFTERNQAWFAPPILTVVGVLAAYVFLRLKIDTFFIWYLAFLAFVFWAGAARAGPAASASPRSPGRRRRARAAMKPT